MSLFEKIKNKRYELQEKRKQRDNSYLFDDGDNSGKNKKYKKPTKAESDAIQTRSLINKTKKFVNQPAKTPKSKGSGTVTGTTRPLVINPKSKGTTPVKVNVTKPVKQSEVSKKAKNFTADINKKRTKRVFPGDKSGAYQAMKADIDAKNLIKKAGGSGDIGFTAPDRKTKVTKRTTRAIKQGTPDPFDIDTSKAAKQTAKDFGTPTKSQIKKLDKKPGGYRAPTGNFGKGLTPGEFRAKQMDKSSFVKTPAAEYDPIKQPRGVKIPGKTYKDFSKKIKTVGVNQADVSRRAKKFSQNISNKVKLNKVQMRGGATNIPAGPTRPPKKYNIPADDRPGKLAQGRDFPSKRSYDAKLAKQVKILRGKANNLAVAKYKAAGQSRVTDRKTGVFSSGVPLKKDPRTGALSPTEVANKLRDRQNQRTKAADALERSLKRKGTTGPTSMLPVVSGKGADAKMPGMGGKTYKQFYKDANVGAYQPPKVKSTPKPPPVNNTVNDTVKNVYKKSKVTSNYTGGFRNTAAFDKRVARMSRGFGGNRGKRALAGKVLRFAKNNPKTALIGGALALGTAYFGGKALSRRGDLNINKDFAKTTRIKNPSGENVRFRYSNRKDKDGNPIYKDQASPYLTKDQKNRIGGTIPGGLTKFRTGQYSVNYKSGGKVGGKLNIDKNMRNSAFEKQLQKAEKGTGFFGRQTQKDKDFLRKYKNATRPTAVK